MVERQWRGFDPVEMGLGTLSVIAALLILITSLRPEFYSGLLVLVPIIAGAIVGGIVGLLGDEAS